MTCIAAASSVVPGGFSTVRFHRHDTMSMNLLQRCLIAVFDHLLQQGLLTLTDYEFQTSISIAISAYHPSHRSKSFNTMQITVGMS